MTGGNTLGLGLAIASAILSNLGTNAQKRSHLMEELLPASEQRAYWLRPFWWVGMSGVVGGAIGDFVALGLATQSLVTAVGGATVLLANIFIARFWNNEDLYGADLWGVLFVVLGAVFFATNAPPPEAYSLQELEERFQRGGFLVYVVFEVLLMALGLSMVRSSKFRNLRVRIIEWLFNSTELARICLDRAMAREELRMSKPVSFAPRHRRETGSVDYRRASSQHTSFSSRSASFSEGSLGGSVDGFNPALFNTPAAEGAEKEPSPERNAPPTVPPAPQGGSSCPPALDRKRAATEGAGDETDWGSGDLRALARLGREASEAIEAGGAPLPEHWSAQYLYAGCAGTVGALSVLLASCASILVQETIEGKGDPMMSWPFWVFLFGMLVTIVLQTDLLNRAMILGDTMSVFPVFQAFWIGLSTVGGAVFYELEWAKNVVGLLCLVFGVMLLCQHGRLAWRAEVERERIDRFMGAVDSVEAKIAAEYSDIGAVGAVSDEWTTGANGQKTLKQNLLAYNPRDKPLSQSEVAELRGAHEMQAAAADYQML
jgi:hypothetical protein